MRDDHLDRVVAELRAPVPVDRAWRARVLDGIGRSEPGSEVLEAHLPAFRRSWKIRPSVAIAAGFLLLICGAAGGMLVANGVRQTASATPNAVTRTAAPTPRPRDLTAVRFVIVAPGAAQVSVVGDFNRWNASATPMRKARDGQSWLVEIALPPGRHVYAFVVDGNVVSDPAAARATDDGFGPPNSVMLVTDARGST